VNGIWIAVDLTVESKTLPSTICLRYAPHGHVFERQGTRHVNYITEDGHLHEMWLDSGGWHHSDFTTSEGAPVAKVLTPWSYAFETQYTQHVDYLGTDKHIHEMWWDTDGWHHNDLTENAQGVAAAGAPTGFVFSADNTQHVFYTSADFHIHELVWSNGQWTDQDLTGSFGGPAVSNQSPRLAAVVLNQMKFLFFLSSDGHVWAMQAANGSWRPVDITAAAGTPAGADAFVCACVSEVENSVYIYYVNDSGNVFELWLGAAGWHADVLPTALPADNAPITSYVSATGRTRQVIYSRLGNLDLSALTWQPLIDRPPLRPGQGRS